jgi:hypothetical protein
MRRELLVLALLAVVACDDRTLPDTPTGDGQTTRDGSLDSPSGLPPVEQVVRACVVAAGCAPAISLPGAFFIGEVPQHTADCVQLFFEGGTLADTRLKARLLACGAKHSGADCAAFHACFGGTWTGPGICRSAAVCQGSRIVRADSPAAYLDCAALGGTCVALGTDFACCATQPCSGPGTVCHSATRGTRCHNGVSVEIECTLGQVCSYAMGCEGTGAKCTSAYPGAPLQPPATCLGPTEVRYCASGAFRKQVTYDCAKNPYASVCAKDPTHSAPCGPAGTECAPGQATCTEDDKLIACVDGFAHEVDCRAIGFNGCTDVQNLTRCTH